MKSGLMSFYHSPKTSASNYEQPTVGKTPPCSVSSQTRPHGRLARLRKVKTSVLSGLLISNLFEVLGFVIGTFLTIKVLAGDSLVVTLDAKIHVPAFAAPVLLPMRQQLFKEPVVIILMGVGIAGACWIRDLRRVPRPVQINQFLGLQAGRLTLSQLLLTHVAPSFSFAEMEALAVGHCRCFVRHDVE